MYSIKAAARATGLTVETLRAWERRHGVVAPLRDANGRRIYRAEDVLRLKRLNEATRRGHPIGRLAQLSDERLSALLNEKPEPTGPTPGHALVQRVLSAAGRYRPEDCEQALSLATALLPPVRLIDDVLAPLLHAVGAYWQDGRFSIAQERLVSCSVRRHAGALLDSYAHAAREPSLVFATLTGEQHELGLLMAAICCASLGARVHFLGPELPPAEIARYARAVDASIVALSFVCQDAVRDMPEQLRALAHELPANVAIWLGGAGVAYLSESELPARCAVISDVSEIERRLGLLRAA
jgi:DNA-binding transcriptional MerR regulator/methylmalonyl-CoA mutase cobalamin-binding subunit